MYYGGTNQETKEQRSKRKEKEEQEKWEKTTPFKESVQEERLKSPAKNIHNPQSF